MNSLEFDALQLRIVSYLKAKGPTTSETLAAQLAAPHGNVYFALEQLRDRKDRVVNLLPFGAVGFRRSEFRSCVVKCSDAQIINVAKAREVQLL